MIRRPPRSTRKESSAASDVYKRQVHGITDFTLVPRESLPHSFSCYGDDSLAAGDYDIEVTVFSSNDIGPQSSTISLSIQEPISLSKSHILISPQFPVYTGEEVTIALIPMTSSSVEKTSGGDLLFASIDNACRRDAYSCRRDYSIDPNDLLFKAESIQLKYTDSGTYEAKFKAPEKAGLLTLNVHRMEHEKIIHECYTWDPAGNYEPGEFLCKSEVAQIHRLSAAEVCPDVENGVLNRWVGKVMTHTTSTVEFDLSLCISSELYIDNELVSMAGTKSLQANQLYEFRLDFWQNSAGTCAPMWKLTPEGNPVMILKQLFFYPVESDYDQNIEVICRPGFY
eukprot:TRINITY_DN1137_c0_g1_i5.p1 TRINITY_DN1137_c0_g1~~TRINITY_DN1137_c0_g1_i5.p1  ORF type:complete len:348 (+),score=28.69 TRINITY_DN1137_c0_g1_i5:26-1045(+)